jgi:hypothetical protein
MTTEFSFILNCFAQPAFAAAAAAAFEQKAFWRGYLLMLISGFLLMTCIHLGIELLS